MKNHKKEEIYRVALLPLFICFLSTWIATVFLFLTLGYIKYIEIVEMITAGIIAVILFILFLKWLIKTEIVGHGIKGMSNDNKRYFVSFDKMERVKVTRFLNLKFLIIYFDVHSKSIYIPLFLRRKHRFIQEVIKRAPENNVLRLYFQEGIGKNKKASWGIKVSKEKLIAEQEKVRDIFYGSVGIFYIIAFSSVVVIFVNIIKSNNKIYVVGLGIVKVIETFAINHSAVQEILYKVLVILKIIVSFSFIFLAYYAEKRRIWSFVLALILYGFDTILLLSLNEYIGAIFHGFIMVCISVGMEEVNLLSEIEEEVKRLE